MGVVGVVGVGMGGWVGGGGGGGGGSYFVRDKPKTRKSLSALPIGVAGPVDMTPAECICRRSLCTRKLWCLPVRQSRESIRRYCAVHGVSSVALWAD